MKKDYSDYKKTKCQKHFPYVKAFSNDELKETLKLAFEMKKNPKKFQNTFLGKSLLMWFEKPSLRTRLSFEIGMAQLGGHAVYVDKRTTHDKKADIKDEVKCMSRYADIIMARVFEQETIEKMMKDSSVPVINGLSNFYHPCQALADVMTIQEFVGNNAVVAYIGDGNNVCNSLIDACKMIGIRIQVATPKGYEPKSKPDLLTDDPNKATLGSDVVYTDAWISMGDESEKEERLKDFQGYQVNKRLIGNRYFMHCLPAIRGQEVTDDVIDSKKSLVYDQAENRMHAQKALMVKLLK